MATKSKSLIITAILAQSAVFMVPGALTPAIADLAAAFPTIAPTTVMMLATLPSLMMVPGNLISGPLTGKAISFRSMLIGAFILLILSGTIPFVLNDFIAILVTRALFGFALGLIQPLGPALIFGLLEQKDQANVMGLTGVAMNIGGIIFQMLGGILCVVSWRHTFLTHLTVIAILIPIILWLPNPPPAPAAVAGAPAPPKFKMPPVIWLIAFLFGLNFIIMMPVMLNMSSIIIEGGLGNAASAGFVLTMNTAGGMVGGALFGTIFKKLGRFTLPTGLTLAAAGFLLLTFAPSIALLTAGTTLMGFGYGFGMPSVMMAIGQLLPPYATPLAFSILNSVSGVGGFLAPMLFAGIMGAFNITWIRFPCIVGFAIVAVFVVIYTLRVLKPPAPAVPAGGPGPGMEQ